MRLSCPACGAEMTLDALAALDATREALVAALALPAPLGRLLMQYLALHRPASRQLSMDRVGRLLADLVEPIQSARVNRHGRDWPAPVETWQAALDQVIGARDTLQLPLKGHGYLFEVVAAIASRAEGRAESTREEARRTPPIEERASRQARAPEGDTRAPIPAQVRDAMASLGIFRRALKESGLEQPGKEDGDAAE